MTDFIARAELTINAPRERVWQVLTTNGSRPEILFGADVQSEWKPGSAITWRGEWQGKTFEDHGVVLEVRAPVRLVVTHFSPLSGQTDAPENYHTLTYTLEPLRDSSTSLTLAQDNNHSPEAAEHSRRNWQTMLEGVRALAERP